MNADTARLFVAVVPPRAILDDIAAAVRPIRGEGLRWGEPAQWHVTLRFLGDADVGAAVGALAGVAGAAAEATIGPAVGELFPGVVGLPVAGLDGLAARARVAMAGIGEADDDRPFVGHLTLARRRDRSKPAIAPTPFVARFAVDEVLLVRSVLAAGGARHDTIGRVGLSR